MIKNAFARQQAMQLPAEAGSVSGSGGQGESTYFWLPIWLSVPGNSVRFALSTIGERFERYSQPQGCQRARACIGLRRAAVRLVSGRVSGANRATVKLSRHGTAMLLAARSFKVTVCEKDNHVGGCNAAILRNGYKFDTVRTFLVMKFILDDGSGEGAMWACFASLAGGINRMLYAALATFETARDCSVEPGCKGGLPRARRRR